MSDAFTIFGMSREEGSAARLVESPLGGPVIQLTAPGGTAEIALQGGQVLSWVPKGFEAVIWLSPVERLGTKKPVRGGTPVCWPWFASHPLDAGKPAHGFVRTRLWDVVRAEQSDTRVRVTLATATTHADKALWPHDAALELQVTLGQDLGLALTTRNTGGSSFALTEALHTYFAVGDIAQATVDGFDGEGYIDKVDGNVRRVQSGPIRFDREVDRIYDEHRGIATIHDATLQRRITINQSGTRSSVVWNPWMAKCARLGDMGPDGYRGMVCVETTNAGTDVVALAPGASHTLNAGYAVERVVT